MTEQPDAITTAAAAFRKLTLTPMPFPAGPVDVPANQLDAYAAIAAAVIQARAIDRQTQAIDRLTAAVAGVASELSDEQPHAARARLRELGLSH
jgi:hypothetical protein